MKKLNKLVLNKARIMSVPQMKNITGGYDGPISGTCCVKGEDKEGPCASCGWSKGLAEGSGDGWCCDSCGTASWSRPCSSY